MAEPKRRHPSFQDLTGQMRGTWLVLEEAQGLKLPRNQQGNVQWRARHSCGAVYIVPGIRLRDRPPIWCDRCRPKKPGRVVRTGGRDG